MLIGVTARQNYKARVRAFFLLIFVTNSSPLLTKKFRRVSNFTYSEEEDEHKGTNLMLVANEDFSDIEVSKKSLLIIGMHEQFRGRIVGESEISAKFPLTKIPNF